MSKKQNRQDQPSAEADSKRIHEQPATAPPPPVENPLPELHARQVELEIQNDELLQSRDLLEESRDRYVDFYDFAPVAYLTLSHKALITEINLTGAAMLGEETGQLRRRRFAEFIAPEDNDLWNRHFMAVRQQDGKLTCALRIQLANGSRLHVQVDSLCRKKEGHEPVVRIALTDITELKRAEAALRESATQLRLLEQREIVQTSLDGFFVLATGSARLTEVNDAFCRMVGYSREELLTMSVPDLKANESPAATAARIKKIVATGYDRFETRYRHKEGRVVDVEVSASYSELDGGIIFVFVRDITGRKQAEKYEQFRSHTLELLAGGAPLPDVLEGIVRGVEQLDSRMICSILLLDSQGKHLVEGVAPSLPDFYNAAINGMSIGIGIGSCGTAAFTGERVIVEDIKTHPYWASFRELASRAGLRACWSEPICSSSGQVLGSFAIYHREVHTPMESDSSIIEKAARLASISIEHKRAERQLHELTMHIQTVREEEKARLAREIHDDLGSTLAVLKLRLTHLLDFELSEEMKKTPLFARLKIMPPLLENAIAATRRIITDLRPPQLDELGLLAALKWQAEQFNKLTGIECRVTCILSEVCDGCGACAGCIACDGQFDEKLTITLFRIFQESLANVARHSGASAVVAEFHPAGREIILSIRDDGRGLPEGHTIAPTSYGMRGMRERVEQLDGQIKFDNQPGGGLTVTVKLPQPAVNKMSNAPP